MYSKSLADSNIRFIMTVFMQRKLGLPIGFGGYLGWWWEVISYGMWRVVMSWFSPAPPAFQSNVTQWSLCTLRWGSHQSRNWWTYLDKYFVLICISFLSFSIFLIFISPFFSFCFSLALQRSHSRHSPGIHLAVCTFCQTVFFFTAIDSMVNL